MTLLNMIEEKSYKALEDLDWKRVSENTLCYLEKYLHPDKNWDREITPKQRINQLRYANVNWETVSDHIRGMGYQNFLKTPYWKAITAHTKFKAGYRCQLCNSSGNLVTHHRHYGIHGFEHAHMHELIALCDRCHNKFHDTKEKNQFPQFNDTKETARFPALKIEIIVILLMVLAIFFVAVLDSDIQKPQASAPSRGFFLLPEFWSWIKDWF